MPRKFEGGNTKPVRMDKSVYQRMAVVAARKHNTVKYAIEYALRQWLRTQPGGDMESNGPENAPADTGLWLRLEKKVDDRIEWAGPYVTVIEARDAIHTLWKERRDLYGATLCFGREHEAITLMLHFERKKADATMTRLQAKADAKC